MKNIDIDLVAPKFALDPSASAQMAAFVSKLQGILQQLVDESGKIKVLDTAPAVGELQTIGDNLGNVFSEVVILNNATQTNRKIYYKDKAGNLRLLDSA